MSLGYTEGFRAFEAKVTLGKSEIYPKHRISTSGLTRGYSGFGGEPSNGSLANNQMVALEDGSLKKIQSWVTVDGGGRLDYSSVINGALVLQGNNAGIGLVVLNIDVAFLKGDLVAISYLRNNSNGNFVHMDSIEVEWNDPLGQDIKHMYGSLQRVGASVNSFLDMGVMNNGGQFPLTDEDEFKWKAPRSGTVLDIVYYGTSPVSVDATPEFVLRKNGIDASVGVMSQHAGFLEERFDGIDVPFVAGDELNFRLKSASNVTNCEGTGAARIQFD